MTEKKRSGDRGEAAVAAYLRKQGYTVLKTQFRTRHGEIDIIARSSENIICFVEVKTRKDDSFAQAREFVTPAKQRRIRAAAQMYLLLRADMDTLCRFDVAEVYSGDGKTAPQLNYIAQAFE